MGGKGKSRNASVEQSMMLYGCVKWKG